MTYGPTKKAEAWALRDNGVRPEEIARRLEVSPSAIRGWLREQAPPPSKLRQKGQPVALTAPAPPPPPAELPAAVANLWADLHREAPGALQKLVELSQDDDGPEATQLGAISASPATRSSAAKPWRKPERPRRSRSRGISSPTRRP